VDGPRVLANMALDSWVPRRFAALSERLTTQNGVVLMGATSLLALLATKGDVAYLVVMYSINVFVTFSMTELSMCKMWISDRARRRDWWRKIMIHAVGLTMCVTILGVTVYEKVLEGGWITLAITSGVIGGCFAVRAHYRKVERVVNAAFAGLETPRPASTPPGAAAVDATLPTAVLLVGSYTGWACTRCSTRSGHFPGTSRTSCSCRRVWLIQAGSRARDLSRN